MQRGPHSQTRSSLGSHIAGFSPDAALPVARWRDERVANEGLYPAPHLFLR
jgi:hypothetical protein